MKTVDRKKPMTVGMISLYALIGIAIGTIGVVYMVTDCLKTIFLVAGFGLMAWALYNLLSPESRRNVFLRSSESSTARVERKRIEEKRDSYGGTHYVYHLVICFKAYQTGRDSIEQHLDAKVSKKLYHKVDHGESIPIRYAKENPQIALVEGEF